MTEKMQQFKDFRNIQSREKNEKATRNSNGNKKTTKTFDLLIDFNKIVTCLDYFMPSSKTIAFVVHVASSA